MNNPFYLKWLDWLLYQPQTATMPKPVKPTLTKATLIYQAAYDNLGKTLYKLLDPYIPMADGCAASCSYVLKEAGYDVPQKGLPTVNLLIDWLLANGFVEVDTPAPGDIVTAHNPDKTVTTNAHTGICLKYGIASNDSDTGRFNENYSYGSWVKYFASHGSKTRYFSPV